jgi:molecular chaperone GrpE (heat shock protein)
MENKEPTEETPTEPAEEAAAADEETAPQTVDKQELTSVQLQDLKMMQDRLLRLRAEFDNYRKRETRDKRASWERAKSTGSRRSSPTRLRATRSSTGSFWLSAICSERWVATA